jgi:hypothetical protein
MRATTLVNRPAYGNCTCPITPDAVHPYVDVVCVWTWRLHAHDLAAFDRRRFRVWRPQQHRFARSLIFFYQPDPATLAAIGRRRHWHLCAVEAALDLVIRAAAARRRRSVLPPPPRARAQR